MNLLFIQTSDIRTRFLFDDIAINFDVSVFFHQLIVHMVPGLGLLIRNSSAQQFSNLEKYAILYNWLTVISLYLMMIAFLHCPIDDQGVVFQGYLIPIVLFTQHKVTIYIIYLFSLIIVNITDYSGCKICLS